jgi:uncharacterized protein YjbI with pentapeptide repeats
MANLEHLKILKQGVDAWNKWREENPNTEPDLVDADITGIDLPGVNLRRAQLSRAHMMCNDFSRADFRNAHLVETDLFDSVLDGVDFSGAFAVYVNPSDAKLNLAKFNRTRFEYVNLSFAELKGADFTGLTMHATVFGDNDLSAVIGLEAVNHDGPSTIGIDTIYRSKGNIPETFLRGCGVPEDFITYMKSIVGKPVDFYSCFISYSSKDDDFAQRLHADLQQKGVRCWFAPEDLKIGDKFRMRIDESIRIYDKHVLILSVNSIRSPWVAEEVEAALEKERKQNKLVLFPIRLDDAVMQTDQAWAASLRRTRHIGDFRAWKDHDRYQKSFERLLRDLKAEGK